MDNFEELIAAISTLSEKSTFDYLISIGPIVLSIVAIFISICTVAKQNKIALFEKRFNVLYKISHIIELAEVADVLEERYIIDEKEHGKTTAFSQRAQNLCAAYNSIFKTNIDYKMNYEESFSIMASAYALYTNLMMAEYLFYPGIETLLSEMADTMVYYVMDTIFQDDNSLSKKQFCEKCSEFKTKWLSKLKKKTQITRELHFERG